MRCTLLRPVSGKEEDQSSSVWVLAEAQSHRVGPFPVARTAGLGARCDAAEQWCWWSGFPAASSTGGWGGGAAATEEPGSLAMAPVFSSCLPSNSFVTIYFPILNPILLKIPGVVSTACAYFLTYLAFIPSHLHMHRRQPARSPSLTLRWSQYIFQDPGSHHYSMPPPSLMFMFQIKFLPFSLSPIPASQADVHPIPLPVGFFCLISIFTFPL